jgi:hypothetical protein
MSGVIPLLPLYAFVAWTGTTVPSFTPGGLDPNLLFLLFLIYLTACQSLLLCSPGVMVWDTVKAGSFSTD